MANTIPDLTVTDLVKNIIFLLIVAAVLFMFLQDIEVPVILDIAFSGVLASFGINVVQDAQTKSAKLKLMKTTYIVEKGKE